jgi:hypothetical protein
MDVARQRNRRGGRRSGCLAGAVLGFFGNVIAFGAFMASQTGAGARGVRPPGHSRMWPLLFLGFFGGMVAGPLIGAVVGSWLGGRVADLRYRPPPGGAPAPKINKGWVAVGTFLGCIVGGAIGMGLTAVFARGMRAAWLMPLLFFLPPALCLILGGFAGLNFAQRRAARQTGK